VRIPETLPQSLRSLPSTAFPPWVGQGSGSGALPSSQLPRINADRARGGLPVMPGSRVDLLPHTQPVAQLQAVGAHLLHLSPAGATAKAVVKKHHEHVPTQIDDPLRFVGRIAERVLIGPHEGAHALAPPVGRLEVEPHT